MTSHLGLMNLHYLHYRTFPLIPNPISDLLVYLGIYRLILLPALTLPKRLKRLEEWLSVGMDRQQLLVLRKVLGKLHLVILEGPVRRAQLKVDLQLIVEARLSLRNVAQCIWYFSSTRILGVSKNNKSRVVSFSTALWEFPSLYL